MSFFNYNVIKDINLKEIFYLIVFIFIIVVILSTQTIFLKKKCLQVLFLYGGSYNSFGGNLAGYKHTAAVSNHPLKLNRRGFIGPSKDRTAVQKCIFRQRCHWLLTSFGQTNL